MLLQERAMLANLSISMWTARKYDKSVSAQVEAANQANDAGRFNKRLVGKGLLADLTKLSDKIRGYHYERTLAWGDNGDRLLPSTQYFDYVAAMRKMRDEWSTLVSQVVNEYPNEIHAARQRLGAMYNASDYPSVNEVARRFNVDISFMPVPDAKDFRVDIADDAAEQIKASITAAIEVRQAGAIKECWNRLRTAVQHAHDRLADDKAIFRDSLVDNLRELTALIPSLNITNDADLNDVCASIKRHLLVDPETLRRDKGLRSDTVKLAGKILQRMPTVH